MRSFSHLAVISIVSCVSFDGIKEVIQCPSQISISDQSIFSYPIDIYQPNKTFTKNETLYSCVGAGSSFLSYHNCSFSPFCPIQESNIQDAAALMTWKPFVEAFCLLNSKISIKPRVFIFGGSVLAGSRTFGCCCVEELSNECPSNKRCKGVNSVPTSPAYRALDTKLCSWPLYLQNLMLLSPLLKDVEVIVLPFAAHDSTMMGSRLPQYLLRKKIQFTKDDIVILDFSVNDGLLFTRSLDMRHHLRTGLEQLVRAILAPPTSISFPTIVLLEMFPLMSEHVRQTFYSQIYIDIARHYNLLLWSYRNVVISPATNKTQGAYLQYLNFQNNLRLFLRKRDFHPPW